jgi:glycosyltransferase involved in cell wall biosynthesis
VYLRLYDQKMKRLQISVCMVIHNEEKTLERCLKSFSDLVSEIIIVHDGKCTDNSLNIAKKYKAKIFVRPFKGYCEYHRPFTFKVAKYDWVLMPDADEYLSPTLQKALARLIKQGVGVYDFLWPGYDKGKTYDNAYKRTLFKKSKIKYFSLQNQNPLPLDNTVKIKRLDYIIHHRRDYDYLNLKLFWKRYQFISNINALQLLERHKFSLYNCKTADLEYRNIIRTRYPLLLGVIGSSLFHISKGIVEAVKDRQFFYFKQGFFTSLYCTMVFGKVFWYKLSK